MHGRISRRDFAEIAVASFGMIALPCRAFSKSDVSAAEKGDPLQPHNVSVPAGAKILVAYASRCGSTAEIAEALGHDLQSRGYRTEIVPVGKVSDVSGLSGCALGQRGSGRELVAGSNRIRPAASARNPKRAKRVLHGTYEEPWR